MAQKGLSATALSNYIADPIQFYNNYVLRILENEELEESIAYQTLGTVIHNTLEELYTPYVTKQLTDQSIENMQDTHMETLQKYFEDKLGKSSHTTGTKPVVIYAAAHSIRSVLEADRKDILADQRLNCWVSKNTVKSNGSMQASNILLHFMALLTALTARTGFCGFWIIKQAKLKLKNCT